MSNDLQKLFSYDGNDVYTVVKDGEPWFAAKHVAESMGIAWHGKDTLSAIPGDWQGVWRFRTPGGMQDMLIINEPAVYKFAFRSQKPEAEKFTTWVAEVMTSIRKTGGYSLEQKDPILSMLESATATRIAQLRLEEEQHRLTLAVNEVELVADEARTVADAAMVTVTGADDFVALVGFARTKGLKMAEKELAMEGRRIGRHIKEHGLEPPRDIPHQKYGTQKAWPKSVLENWWFHDYQARRQPA